jgi:hypothetical protein
MKRVALFLVVLGVAAGSYALLAGHQPKLEANPKLEPGMEFHTFATFWFHKGDSNQLICLVADDGTCYQIPTAWKTALEQVTEGEAVTLPPTWHLWPRIGDKNISSASDRTTETEKRGVGTIEAGGGYHHHRVFYAPAPKKQSD